MILRIAQRKTRDAENYRHNATDRLYAFAEGRVYAYTHARQGHLQTRMSAIHWWSIGRGTLAGKPNSITDENGESPMGLMTHRHHFHISTRSKALMPVRGMVIFR